MSDYKDKMIEDSESDPDNWITRKCCECPTLVRIMVTDEAVMSGESPVYCDEHNPNRPD